MRSWRTLVAALALAAVAAVGCIEVHIEREVDVTAGAVPEEVRDARWQSFPVEYCVVPSEDGFVEATRFIEIAAEAFADWGMEVVYAGECGALEHGNGRNEITWGVPPEQGDGLHAAGYTRMMFRTCRGACADGSQAELIEADIVIHPEPPDRFDSEDCLRSTLLHEAGHFLGLPHIDGPAVMAPATSSCPQTLTDADREAMRVLYE